MKRHSRIVVGGLALAVMIGAPAPAVASDHDPNQRSRFHGPGFRAPHIETARTPAVLGRDWDASPAVDQRAEQILARMTNEEKADLATGELNNFFGFYNNPVPRVGIPAQTMADGPVGVRVANPNVDQRTTQLPSGSALAASFDNRLARAYGTILGVEAFHTGHNVMLGPTLDITRTPLWGRAFEGFGEDPLVSGTNGALVTKGIQSQPVIATLKHPFVYNQETDRFDVDAVVSERALREIYVRPFEIAQQRGRPGAMMCSFNRVNGTHSCESPLMNTILKQQLQFRGFVMSDYNATPSTVQAANSGLDQEQPGDQGPGSANFGERLLAAVAAGQVSQARLDDMARRILRPMVGLGLFDHQPSNSPWPVQQHAQQARTIAARGMVLLKNQRRVLPLRARSPRRIVVIGPDADNISAQGGGSSEATHPTTAVSPLQGIAAAATGPVGYSQGVDGISEGDMLPGPYPVPSSVLSPAAGSRQGGLSATYWSNTTFSGDPVLTQVDPVVNDNFGFVNFPGFNAASPKIPTSRGNFALTGDLSARWTGLMTAPATATYTLGLTARGDARLYLNGTLFVQHAGDLSSVGRTIRLTAGQQVDVRIEYSAPAANQYTGGQVRFFWQHPESVMSPMMQAAVRQARSARTAIVVVRDYESEGFDRTSLALPKEQEQLIRRVAAVNPRTIVVVETGTVSRVSTWQRRVRSVVQAWYPGQEQGNAIADVLFGRVNPSGHLPATLPRNERQVPDIRSGTVRFTEGLRVGYRSRRLTRRASYPFGHGLSYTRFRYDRLRVRAPRGPDGTAIARFTVRNTGRRPGIAVPQLYVGRLPAPVSTPWRQLIGYRAVRLGAGRSRTVRVRVPALQLSYWDAAADRWVLPRGRVRVYLGASVKRSSDTVTVRLRG